MMVCKVTEKKVDYHSIPCKSIRHFAVESAGSFDLDVELKIWEADMGADPIVNAFSKNADAMMLGEKTGS